MISERNVQALKVHSRSRERIWRRVCYKCRKPGHIQRDFPVLQARFEYDVKVTVKNSPSVCLDVGGVRRKNSWYVNAGCTNHMTDGRKFFRKFDGNVKQRMFLAIESAGIRGRFQNYIDDRREVDRMTVKVGFVRS